MKRIFFKPWRTGLLILALSITLAACDSQSAIEQESADTTVQAVTAMTTQLSQDLSLTSAQQREVQSMVSRNEHRMKDPGLLWYLAAELQATLSDEQKQRLFALAEQAQGHPGGFGPSHDRPGQGGPGHGGPGGSCLADVLTDEQEAAVTAIRDTYRPQIEALHEARRDGSITDEEFRAQVQALHEAMKAEVDALLSDEQKAAIEACRAEQEAEREAARAAQQEAVRAAMIEALGLSDQQIADLDALIAAQQAERDAIRAQVDAGTLSREDAHEALTALRDAGNAAMQTILDDTQWEIKLIHDALAIRMGHGGRPGGPGGHRPGGGGPGGNGTGG